MTAPGDEFPNPAGAMPVSACGRPLQTVVDTEADYFRAIAAEFVAGKQSYGICYAINWTQTHERRFRLDVCRQRMSQRVQSHLGFTYFAYSTDTGRYRREDEARALACLWLALDAEAGIEP